MMSKLLLIVFSLLGLWSECVSQVVQDGQCDENVPLVQDFEFEKFLGTWVEIARTDNPNQPGDCSSFTLTNDDVPQVQYSSVNQNFVENARGAVSKMDDTAKLSLNILFQNPIDFWVRVTDYTNYAVTFSCENISTTQRRIHLWVLGRQTTFPSEMTVALISTTIWNTFAIEYSTLRTIDHDEDVCYVLPLIEPGAPVILPGQCDLNIQAVPSFNVNRFVGLWHQISSYETSNTNGACVRAKYTLVDNVVTVLNSEVLDQELFTIEGYASVSSTDNSAKLTVVLNIPGGSPTTQDLWVLATDYESYAVLYACANEGETQKRVYSWILSRSRQLPASSQAAVDQAVNSFLDLNYMFYNPTDQSDEACFYYPEEVPGQSVVFNGQCESVNLQPMTGFNFEQFMGTWNSLQQYPSRFENGNCRKVFYELGDGRINVVNSQVKDQTLHTISAVAVPASNDGTAKFIVSFPNEVTDQSYEYWVLATDYTSYAFVYTCTNINPDEMRVGSWKLSKSTVLPIVGENNINNIISTVPVLDQRYYENVDQSVESCFYYPEPRPNVPVVYPGQCAMEIPTVEDFDFEKFEGEWNEIQAYPLPGQTRQCVSHHYTFVDNTRLDLAYSSVSNQVQEERNGVVTRTSETGYLTITYSDDNGIVQNIPYWIVSTDYTDYALAYSCININTESRGVWSWKLSRSRQLSEAGNAAINNAIADIDVLRDDYYEDVQQTDSACFHLPDITPGQNVVLPGQCDTTIKGIPNFDLARYAGEWRLIENYGSRYQSGTCNIAHYTVQSSDTLALTNSQVGADGALGSISGTATLTSTDGSGQLMFNMRNRQYELFILDTDYVSYSLVYGCVNSGSDQRRILSWKFSRTNTLSETATNNINQIMSSMEVLHQPYYYIVDRSPEACFYFPEPDPNTPVRFRGQCDESIPVVENFNVELFLGLWHDIESYPVPFQGGSCPNAYYALSGSNTVSVTNTQVVGQSLDVINGFASVVSTDGTAKLKVTFDAQNPEATSDYWVLGTDYTSYAFVYSCRNINDDYMSVASWKLSRTKALTPQATTAIDNVMNNVRALDQRYYVPRDQSPAGCFYYPEPQPGVPVVFPGQCDDSIAAQQNFDINQFQGTWHEIAAYPDTSKSGQCMSQQFTVNGDNTMSLESISVLDLVQLSTQGQVTVASNDGSGKLNINLGANGEVVIPYWIVSTDYTDYALAYSCININTESRGVWSWKLSRSRQLSEAGNVAINNAIANIDVLRDDYYEDVQQADGACFHLPDITPGQNVVLPGQCDTTIKGIPNFDLARYAGEWRLIENYGSRYQSGTCNIAHYTVQSSDTFALTNSQVGVDGALGSISGTATLTSTDGSGQLMFNMRNRQYELFILDTDYVSYSLVYGCVNSGSDQRRILSWKFSRTNTLSETATNNINQIMSSMEVLHQPYYYIVDRSPEACFYFPEPDPNTPVRFRGQCDESIPVVENFNVELFLGLWHDIESYPVPFQGGSCPNAYYALSGSNTVSVTNTQVVGQSLDVINGFASVVSTDGTAKLKVTFDAQNPEATSDYWVLGTDYTSYAFVYSCRNINDDYMSVASWKLSRTKALTPQATTAIDNVMNNVRALDQRYYVPRDQSPAGCFYYPEPQPGVPVVFPGQCDDSIAAQQNFDINEFQGTWHEIAAYPDTSKSGQCMSQQFTVNGDNTMSLESISVLDLVQLSTQGQVTVASNDGSGKLNINLGANGEVVIPYWIVSTDYTDYALAYSCININTESRGVWSWKLSRSRQLSEAGNAAINNAIANIDVLRDDYYEDVQQTDGACFHLPELGPTDPVVLLGQCDANIPVVQSFDATRYMGRWRLIESYYSEFQEGTCNAATYSLADDGSVLVFNSKVVDEQLHSITGTAVPVSNDGSGKLFVTFPNSVSPMEYWMLDTDYNSYALVYSCANLPNNERRVWSWKLSRSSTLTTNAINSMNQVITSIDVLDARYYQSVDRTEISCFYYPTPDSTSNVIFPGQCDENIQAVPAFNIDLYKGTWYDVESYPSNFQSGTCNTATYTVNSDGTFNVQNTQVVEQILQTVTGAAAQTSTDGSAKYTITYTLSNGNVITTKYWVLATDYETFSLVYSCRNIDDEFREVHSWKLGRSPTLPDTAISEINVSINGIQVLGQEYFVQRSHTEEACFYYPDNQGGDVVLKGLCLPDDQVPAVDNFNADAFTGTWHEVARFPSTLQNSECTATEYSSNDAGGFNFILSSVIDEQLLTTTAQAELAPDGRGVISVNVDGVPFANIYILATDYEEYALAYSCRNIDTDRKQIYSWKLSRFRAGLSAAAENAISELVTTNVDLFEPYYENTGQDNTACFYYPMFEELPPTIELPGPCDKSITGIPNFAPSIYTGYWYEVARYPNSAQIGQCNRAEYGPLTGGVFSVENSQVANEALSTISGEANIASEDGFGQIEVTFNIAEEDRKLPYFVLATDYISYSLVYSCTDLPNGNRQVGSWKLSRTPTLSSQAEAAMDYVISNTQGLHENYYQVTKQDDESCFYYPLQTGPQVVIPGQCDENVPVVQSFDVTGFQGTWYQIKRYSAVEDSSCIGIRLSQDESSGDIGVILFEVVDEDLITTKGSGRLNSTDSSGKLSLVLPIEVEDGETTETIIHILATDYKEYALAYSCKNIDSLQRQIGVWQLSRERTMSESGQTAIAALMEQRRELHEPFFKTIEQKDDCPEPSSAVLFKSSIIVIFLCTVLQLVW